MSAKAIIKKEKKKIAYKPKRIRNAANMIHADEEGRSLPKKNPRDFKAECNREHAKYNAMQRHGISEDLLNKGVELIEEATRSSSVKLYSMIDDGSGVSITGAAILLRPDHRGKNRCLWAVSLYPGEWIPIVYDNATKSPVSVLPHSVLQDYNHILGTST